MHLRKINDEVFYAEGAIATLGTAEVEMIVAQASRNPRKIARICTHRDPGDRLHEMTIANLRDTYIRPHKNTNKPKSFLVIEGAMDVVTFNDGGDVTGVTRLAGREPGTQFYFRLHETLFHSLRIVTPFVVFQETTIGPFTAGDTVFASWAPDNTNPAAIRAFMDHMDRAALRFLP